jgi:hypothetical protein
MKRLALKLLQAIGRYQAGKADFERLSGASCPRISSIYFHQQSLPFVH